jgi:hypothetical protein
MCGGFRPELWLFAEVALILLQCCMLVMMLVHYVAEYIS